MFTITMKFDGFGDRDMEREIERAATEKLRKAGLSHVRVSARKAGRDQFDISLDGATPEEEERARDILTD